MAGLKKRASTGDSMAQKPAEAPRAAHPIRPTDDEARALGRELLRGGRSGTLASLAPDGSPFASLVGLATDHDGTPLILTSRLSAHTGHLLADARAGLLIARGGKGDPMAHPRLSLRVRAEAVPPESEAAQRVRRRYLARQPKAALYVDFPDFGFFALRVEGASLNGGFGRAYALAPGDLLCEPTAAASIAEVEAAAIAHMNADHAEAVALYATRLLGARSGRWRLTGIDPHGVDLALGDQVLRLAFPTPLAGAADLRPALVDLARRARAAPATT